MNGYAYQLLPALLLATLGLTAAALVTWCLLRYSRAVSPRVHRLAWCAVLLVGWSFARLPIEVPWYDPVPPAELAANLGETLPTLSVAPPNEEVIEAPADAGVIELSGTYVELSPEPVASTAGAEPLIELAVTPELSAPILAEIPPVLLVPPAAVPKSPEPVVRPFWADIDPWITLAALWVAGIGAIVLAWLTGYLWFVLRLPVGRSADPSWLEEWRTLLDSRGERRSIPLRVTLSLGPMLCRMPRGYTLVVPEPLWRELDESGRRAILRHELAHYERGDVWWSLLARVLALPNWFNPASWYCVRKFDEAAEWACDRAATADQPVTDYAKALLRLGTDAHGYASYRPAAAGKPLAGRIRRLLRLRNERDSKFKAALLIAAALVMATAALVQVELVAREAPEAKIADAERQPQPVDTPERIGPLDDEGAIPGPVDESDVQPVADLEVRRDPAADQTKLLTAAQAAADGARKAYEGTIKAYEYGRGNPDSVYTWSLRWMDAAGRVPPDIKEGQSTIRVDKTRLDAAKAHLERMKELQTRVKAQYDTGTVTYEVIAAADYYAAEAERNLAELEAAPGDVSGTLSISPQPSVPNVTLTPTPATTTAPALAPTPLESQPIPQPSDARARALSPSRAEGKSIGGRGMAGKTMGGPRPIRGGLPLLGPADLAAESRKYSLRYDGKSYNEWGKILTTELSEEGQFKAIDALGAFAAKGYGAEVATVLLDIRPEPRSGLSVKIVNALLKIPKEVAVPHLATAGKSDDEVTRRLALIALANAAPTSAETKAALKSALHDASPIVVEAAINLMGAGTHEKYYLAETRFPAMPELAPDLAELLSKLNQNRTEAGGNLDIAYLVNALELCGPAAKVAFPTVIPWLASEDWNTRVRAFSIIGAVGAEAGEALPALIALLKESPGIDAQRRASSLEAGRMGGGGQSLTAITLATLAKIGPPAKEAVPTILESVKHTRDQDDLEAAINALEAIGPLSKEAVPLLIRAFGQHPISMMKKLGQIGPDAEEAIPLLKQFAENAEIAPEYSEAAREALKKIQPEAK